MQLTGVPAGANRTVLTAAAAGGHDHRKGEGAADPGDPLRAAGGPRVRAGCRDRWRRRARMNLLAKGANNAKGGYDVRVSRRLAADKLGHHRAGNSLGGGCGWTGGVGDSAVARKPANVFRGIRRSPVVAPFRERISQPYDRQKAAPAASCCQVNVRQSR